MIHNILSIAGSDPSGGAGIQADLKTFGALGAYGMAAITALTAQNTQGVRSFVAMEPDFVAAQIDAVFEDVRVDAVKIGMIATAGIAEAVAGRLAAHGAKNIVLDPVMVATSGDALLAPDAAQALISRLIPLATILTPNLPEAAKLIGAAPIRTLAQMRAALPALQGLGAGWVLLKGGHLEDDPDAVDLLVESSSGEILELRAPRVATKNTHGTGCTLSSALATLLPGRGVAEGARAAKAYLTGALKAADRLEVGRGHGPVNHFWRGGQT
jgi:hydroxymethylpyrimidine/phosphomethylpyrimidine kinase